MSVRFPMYVIYDHPREYPGHFVVRIWDGDKPTHLLTIHDSLEAARKAIPGDRFCLPRHLQDEPQIVETWI